MSTIRANTIVNMDGVTAVTLTGQRAAKSWSNFNGTNASVRRSFNVSSVTKNSTGQWYVNMSTSMPDTSYGCSAGSGYVIANFATGFVSTFPSSTSVQGIAKYSSSFQDEEIVHSNVLS